MRFCKSRNFPRVLQGGLVFLMIAVLGLLLTLPWSITWIAERTPDDPEGMYVKYLVVLAYSGVMSELILWQARGMLRNVICGNVFSADTVRRLRTAAVEILVLGAFYLLTMPWVSKFFMAFLFVVMVLGGCLLLVLAEIFCQANRYKEENDMTI